MPQLATGPLRRSDNVLTKHSATPSALQGAQHNMIAAKHLLNAEDFAAVAGALRVAALNFVQPLTGSGDQPQLLYQTILEYRLGFGLFTACRRFIKARRAHVKKGLAPDVAGLGLCLALLADALGCWWYVSGAMEIRHKITFLRQAATMQVNLENFISALRLIGYMRQLDPSVKVVKLLEQCRGNLKDSPGFQSKVVPGQELDGMMMSLDIVIDGCVQLRIDAVEVINLKGLTMVYQAQTDQELLVAKDELRSAYSLAAFDEDIRKEAEVLLNLGLVFRGRTNEIRRACKVAHEVRELDSRAVNLGKASFLRPKRSDSLQTQPTASDKGPPPRWNLSSSNPADEWTKSIKKEAPVQEVDERWNEVAELFKGKTLQQIFDMYDTDRSGSIGGFEIAAIFEDAVGEHVDGMATAALAKFGGDDETLNFHEFCDLWRFLHAHDDQFELDGHVDHVADMFHMLDADGNGVLGATEIQEYLKTNTDLDVDEAWVRTLLQDYHQYDANGDGGLDLDEFRALHLEAATKHRADIGFVSKYSQRELPVISTTPIDDRASNAMADAAAAQYQSSSTEEKRGLFAKRKLFSKGKSEGGPQQQQELGQDNSWAQDLTQGAAAAQVVDLLAARLSELHAFDTPGPFRVSGALSEVEALEERLAGLGPHATLAAIKEVLSDCRDVHVLTSLFKRWLRTAVQQTPFIPRELLPASEALADSCRPEQNVGPEYAEAAVKGFFGNLPRSSKPLVRSIMAVLQQTVAAEASTRMDAANLGKVFAPTLIHREQAEFTKVDMDAHTIALMIQFLPGTVVPAPAPVASASPTSMAASLRKKTGKADGEGTELRRLFDQFDTSGDGVLQQAEVTKILEMRSATGVMDPQNALRIFGRFDVDGSGGLEFPEFVQLWHAVGEAKIDPDWIPPPPQQDP